ncbi:hypothetical protein RYX36_019157 [Vicia faba]
MSRLVHRYISDNEPTVASGKHLRKCDFALRSHVHYYINDDNNKDAIAAGYTSADDAVPINFGMNYDREHKQESRERWLERNLNPNDMASAAVATVASLVASHCLEIAKYMGAEHEQIATAVDSAINAKKNGDIMTLTVGETIALREAATLNARLKRGIGATMIPSVEDKCGEAKKASILTTLDFVFQGGVLLKRTRKCNCLKNKYLHSLTNHVFSVFIIITTSIDEIKTNFTYSLIIARLFTTSYHIDFDIKAGADKFGNISILCNCRRCI